MSGANEHEQILAWHQKFSALAQLTKGATQFEELAKRYLECPELHERGADPWDTTPWIIDLAERFTTMLDQFFYDPEKHDLPVTAPAEERQQTKMVH